MFDFVSSFKFQEKKSNTKSSEETHKQKPKRWSDTFSNIKSSIIHKTNSLSSYLAPSSNISTTETTKTTPDLSEECFYYYNEANSDYDIGYFTMLNVKSDCTPSDRQYINNGEVESDIIDKFIRVVNVEDDCPASPGFNRRNDREEIRRRLATGCDTDEYYGGDRPGKKPSLQARLQSGMNLQICFMNDTMSDTESPGTETPETASVTPSPIKAKTNPEPPRATNLPNKQCVKSGLSLPLNNSCAMTEADFFARQARLQSEARVALAQAKDMARMQMEVERQQRQASPITEMLRVSLKKVGVHFPEERRRLSRQMLTDMNLAQLQVIVNDLHTQIEYLNEGLVKFLMERDDLHMSQDSMLVDIEDLTRYLGAKENTLKEDISQNNNVITPNPKINRIANGVKK